MTNMPIDYAMLLKMLFCILNDGEGLRHAMQKGAFRFLPQFKFDVLHYGPK
jgi:hypothetical protein